MSLLDTLLSLTLTIVLTSIILTSLSALTNWSLEADKKIKEMKNIISIHGVLSESLSSLDRHRYPLSPRIHSNGEILFTDQSPTHLLSKKDGKAPQSESDALSILAIDAENTILLFETHSQLCTKNLIDRETPFPAIASTADKAFEVLVQLQRDETCQKAHLKIAEKSMFFIQPENHQELSRVRWLLPIIENATYYISQNYTLRFVQFRGKQIIENQPVREDFPNLKLSSENESTHFYSITARLSKNDQTLFTQTYSHHLSRMAMVPLLLQEERS